MRQPSYWPTYRPRQAVTAKRLNTPTLVDGRLYVAGYIVRDSEGREHVMTVAAFEAVYELATREEV